jgi:hypothetical protein
LVGAQLFAINPHNIRKGLGGIVQWIAILP